MIKILATTAIALLLATSAFAGNPSGPDTAQSSGGSIVAGGSAGGLYSTAGHNSTVDSWTYGSYNSDAKTTVTTKISCGCEEGGERTTSGISSSVQNAFGDAYNNFVNTGDNSHSMGGSAFVGFSAAAGTFSFGGSTPPPRRRR